MAVSQTVIDDSYAYRRNSVYTVMVNHPEYSFGEELEAIFKELPLNPRFNDHNLGVRAVNFGSSDRNDQRANINKFIAEVDLAKKMVSKWFCRDKATGAFSLDLVKERGLTNAHLVDWELAKASVRGKAILEDAGEELIPQTYLIFNDIIYNSRSGFGSVLKMAANIYVGNVDGLQDSMQEIAGFKVTIKSYLYRLVWNEEIASVFYNNMYFDSSNIDASKKKLFDTDQTLFRLEYVGMTESSNQKTSFQGVKQPRDLLRKICARVIDHNISDLQHTFPDFRIKAPLMSINPLRADIGLKEGVSENSQFEVLETIIEESGKMKYRRVGVIKPKKGQIKDNRYMAVEEEAEGATLEGSEFEIVSGKDFYPGMLIREL